MYKNIIGWAQQNAIYYLWWYKKLIMANNVQPNDEKHQKKVITWLIGNFQILVRLFRDINLTLTRIL